MRKGVLLVSSRLYTGVKPGIFMAIGPELKAVLEETAEVLEEMLELEEKTQQALVQRDAGLVEQLNLQREELQHKMGSAEAKRAGLAPKGLSLKEYVLTHNPPETEDLLGLRKRILQLLSSLKRLQKINHNLLSHNLQFFEAALDTLFPGRDCASYAPSGRLQKGNLPSSGVLDSNA